MCRWLAYSGSPSLEELLLKRDRSLIDQSLHSRQGASRRTGRLRRRLVRRGRDTAALPQCPSGLERPQPARARRRDLVAPLPRPHPRLDGYCDPGDQRAPVPLRAVALDAQRPDPRVPADEARARARDRRLALPSIEGTTDSETMFYLALTFGSRATRSPRSRGWSASSRRPAPAGHRTPPSDDDRDVRRGSVYAFRYSSEGESRSLYFSTRMERCGALPGERRVRRPVGRDASRRLRASRRPRGRLERSARIPRRHHPPGPDELRPFAPQR